MATATSTLSWFLDSATAARSAGAWEKALVQYETSLARVAREGDARLAAEILRGIGNVHYARGDFEHARDAFTVSLTIAEASGLTDQMASALNCLAVVEQFGGGVEHAESLYARAREIAEELGDDRRAAMIEQNLGTLANVRGDTHLALTRYQAACDRFDALDDTLAATRVLNNMGMVYVDLESWTAAEDCFAQASERAVALGDRDTLGTIEINRTELRLRRGQVEEARVCCDRAFDIFSRLESKAGIAETSKFYGSIARATGKLDTAKTHLSLALGLARLCGDRLLEAEVERELSLVQLEDGKDREAVRCLNRAHRLFTELKAAREVLDIERRLDRLEEIYLEAARRWAETVDAKDHCTLGHSLRVAEYACRLGDAVGIGGRDLTSLRMGALLHDVGMANVPDEILTRPGGLSGPEYSMIRSHTEYGDRMIQELDFPWEIGPMVRAHHERWDGRGYPDGLRGEQIPLTARVVAVAEVYDALTTPRSYRPARPPQDALAEMERESGSLFDPALFQLFRGLVGGDAAIERRAS
ncbi:MAG: tetratricopeptide repeat protein [Gemmatimonadetes bacterium]|nr:tetratricopeptide repeat protein [Gemmatimonadota bacterium]